MNQQRRINWPALSAAAAITLAVVLGLPAAMDARTTSYGYLSTLAAADQAARTDVSIQPARIEVIAVRAHPTMHGFWVATNKRAG